MHHRKPAESTPHLSKQIWAQILDSRPEYLVPTLAVMPCQHPFFQLPSQPQCGKPASRATILPSNLRVNVYAYNIGPPAQNHPFAWQHDCRPTCRRQPPKVGWCLSFDSSRASPGISNDIPGPHGSFADVQQPQIMFLDLCGWAPGRQPPAPVQAHRHRLLLLTGSEIDYCGRQPQLDGTTRGLVSP